MLKSITILLKDHFAASISTRMSVRNLLDDFLKYPDNQEVIIDFSGIEFISPSAAHEFILYSRDFMKKGKIIRFINTSSRVNQIIAIAKKRRKTRRPKQKISHISFNTYQDMINYFSRT